MPLLSSRARALSTVLGTSLTLGITSVVADTSLPAVINEATPTEFIQESPLLPASQHENNTTTGSSGIERSVSNQLPLPVAMPSTPGAYSSFRGLGRSSDEINFQAFGVPLNGPQGGGFDLSSFPQFLWSDYRYQAGPSLGSFDSRASGGTVNLVPWTQKALNSKEELSFRFMQNHSFAGQSQISLGAQVQQRAAVIAGYSDGFARGPSAALSSRWGSGKLQSQLHFLGSRLDTEVPGPKNAPSPNARQITARVIPVLQTDYAISEKSKFKNSFFFDSTQIDYKNPDIGFSDQSNIKQYGVDNAWTDSSVKLGLGAKYTTYQTLTFRSQEQTQFRLSGSKVFDLGTFTLEPLLQATWVTTQDLLPEGSLTARREWLESGLAVYARGAYSRRTPSLVDLYYRDLYFRGNPNLKSETNYTAILGGEHIRGRLKNSLQLYFQSIQDTQVAHYSGLIGTMKNSGNAWVASATHTVRWQMCEGADVSHALNWSNSEITQLGTPYPYLPTLLSLLNFNVYAKGDDPKWTVQQTLRTSTRTVAGIGQNIGGYTLWDLGGRMRVARFKELGSSAQTLYAGLRIENMMNRTNIEWVRNYALPGRTWIIHVVAEF